MSDPSTCRLARTALVALTVPGMLACGPDDAAARRDSIVAAADSAYKASHAASAPPEAPAAAAARAPASMTDNNILARIAQDDRLEVRVAGLAIAKATSPALKNFAREIRDNHSAGENDARKLSQALKIPEQPAADDSTKVHEQNLTAQLTKLSKGLTFDTTYVRHLVDGHTAMLRDIRIMEGKATHAEVKKLLVAAEPEVQRHLNRARAIGKSLTAPKKPGA